MRIFEKFIFFFNKGSVIHSIRIKNNDKYMNLKAYISGVVKNWMSFGLQVCALILVFYIIVLLMLATITKFFNCIRIAI